MLGGNDEDLKWVDEGSCSQVRHRSEGCSGFQKMKTRKTKYCSGDSSGRGVGELNGSADVKHWKRLLERFGLDGNAKALSVNGEWGDWVSTAGEDQDTDVFPDEAQGVPCSSREIELLGSGFSRCSISSKGPIVGDGQPNDGELEETEEGRSVS